VSEVSNGEQQPAIASKFCVMRRGRRKEGGRGFKARHRDRIDGEQEGGVGVG
jgi:hypothetical protein